MDSLIPKSLLTMEIPVKPCTSFMVPVSANSSPGAATTFSKTVPLGAAAPEPHSTEMLAVIVEVYQSTQAVGSGPKISMY